MTGLNAPVEREVTVGDLTIASMQRGTGRPLLVLHHSTGTAGWNRFTDLLAEDFQVIVPDLPGYGHSTMPEWAREPRDLAILMLQYLRKLGLNEGVTLVGLGLGGWIAAELATMNHAPLSSMVLIGAPGLRPEEGEIMDQMVIDPTEYARAGFRDNATAIQHLGEAVDPDLVTLWQFNRVMTARVSWKPYMFSLRLAKLLAEVPTPVLLINGSVDRVIPSAIARQYERALPNAQRNTVEGAGHLVEIEEPERVVDLIKQHVNTHAPSLRA